MKYRVEYDQDKTFIVRVKDGEEQVVLSMEDLANPERICYMLEHETNVSFGAGWTRGSREEQELMKKQILRKLGF